MQIEISETSEIVVENVGETLYLVTTGCNSK